MSNDLKNKKIVPLEEKKALKMAIDALEKQIPKKMKVHILFGREGLECPECGKLINVFDVHNYCPSCGQAIM